MQRLPSLSVCFPAFNDGGTIATMVIAAAKTAPQVTERFEIVVTNDGSRDYTGEILDELQRLYPEHLRVVTHEGNRGYGAALRSAFAAARNDWIFYTDGDAQYDAREMTRLVEALAPGIDVVNGWKISRHDRWYRIVLGRAYHHVAKLAFGFSIRDVDCDFRLIRRSALAAIELRSNTGTICVEMVKKLEDAGCAFAEVPVTHHHRAYGRSQFFNLPRLWRTGLQLIALWRELVLEPRLRPAPRVQAARHE